MNAAASAPPPAQASAPGALWSPSDAAPPIRPPPAVQHPLRLLEEFLTSIDREEEEDEDAKINKDCNGEDQQQEQESHQEEAARNQNQDRRIRRVLRVADFLYGGDSSSSARSRTVLDNALEVLDGGAGGYGYEHRGVRCYRAQPSGRVAYVVRGSGRGGGSNNNNGGNVGGVGAGGGGSRSSGDYLCFLPEMAGSSSSSGSSDGPDGGCFCPCRSFFERTKADRRAVCKHLLAARLGPYLQSGYGEYEVSDVQFAQIVLQQSFLPAG